MKKPGSLLLLGLLCLSTGCDSYIRMAPELETHQALRSRLVRLDITVLFRAVQFSTKALPQSLCFAAHYQCS